MIIFVPIYITSAKQLLSLQLDFHTATRNKEILNHKVNFLMPCPSIGPKLFWIVQIILDRYKSFWLGPNHFGRIQIIFVMFKLDFSGLFFIIWTYPK